MTADNTVQKKTASLWSSPFVPVIVVILCLSPFVNKAFHIDDPLFVWTAQHIQKQPFDFYGFSVNWYTTEMPMAEVTKNPPLASYYLAGVASITGYHEIGLHLGFIPIAVAAALGTFYLSRRFCANPALATLITILTPAFLVSGTTLMCDMMLLAFWTWSLFFWMRGMETRKNIHLLLSALFVSLAIMTKYFGVVLIALLCVYAVVQKPRRWGWMIYLLMPLATMLVYQWLTISLYGKDLFGNALIYVTEIENKSGPISLHQCLVALAFTGGCLLPVLFYSPFLWSARTLCVGVAVAVLFVVILYFSPAIGKTVIRDKDGIRWDLILTLSLMAAAGVSLLGLAWDECQRNKCNDTLLLILWILGTFSFAGFINWATNARSILPMAPAVGILVCKRLERKKNGNRMAAIRYITPLLPVAVIAIAITWADYTLAGTTRTAADIIHRDYAAANQKIWFEGHWGFQFYMQAYGHKPVDIKKRDISAGDIIVVPMNNVNTVPLKEDRISLKNILQVTSCRWLTTMQNDLGAGFYMHSKGPVPFLFGKIPPETYFLFETKSPALK